MLARSASRLGLSIPRWAGTSNVCRPTIFTCHVPSSVRDFHLESKDIPEFLSKAGASIASCVKIESSSNTLPICDQGVAVLISADRDPQSWPADADARTGNFFGPSILSARVSSLAPLDKTYFGRGGLGLLKLRQQKPASISHVAVRSNTSSLAESQLTSLVHGLASKEAQNVIAAMWKVFDQYEGLWFSFTLVPAQGDTEVKVVAPYMEFDDFAVRRQPLLKPYFESRPRHTNTARAEDGGLFFVKLSDVDAPTLTQASAGKELPEGNIGCFGYGAGNAMATMDGLNVAGGRPANFLDGGGGANRTNAKLAVETLNRDPAVKAIFINTFGGITRTDIVSQGIIDAVKDDKITKPIVVRMKGTGSEDAAKVLQASGLEFAFHDDFNAAAAHAVRAANQGHL